MLKQLNDGLCARREMRRERIGRCTGPFVDTANPPAIRLNIDRRDKDSPSRAVGGMATSEKRFMSDS
jgi:hypothetical protein